ncbi:MAG: phosphate acetyltransferase, partial [Rhodomicrobium sp.]
MKTLEPAAGQRSKYDIFLERAKQAPSPRTIAVYPCDETSLRAVVEAAEARLIEPVLVGPAEKIRSVARKYQLNISPFEIVNADESEEAAAKGVQLIKEGKGEVLMKGSLHTDELMRSVTSPATGLRTKRRISHV